MLNKAILIGRISSELELKYTPNGKAVCEFSIAVNRIGSEETDFLTCKVWNKQAENLVNYQDKGSLIAIEGSNRVDKYQNEQGQNRYKNYILVSSIQFLESKKDQSSNNNQISEPPKEEPKEDLYQDFANDNAKELENFELPF